MGIGDAPLSNLYESLVFFSLTIAVLYFFIEIRYKTRTISAFAGVIVFLAMSYASLSPNVSDRIQPLIPALKSNWLIAHVTTCFLGYAGLAVAFGISILYFIKNAGENNESPLFARIRGLTMLDELTHQMVMFGFFFLSINLRGFQDRPFHVMLKPRMDCDFIKIFSTTNSRPLEHRTAASGVSIRCFFGRVTVNGMVFPGLLGKSPESRQPVHERFTPTAA